LGGGVGREPARPGPIREWWGLMGPGRGLLQATWAWRAWGLGAGGLAGWPAARPGPWMAERAAAARI
jgi:hypothetical protein